MAAARSPGSPERRGEWAGGLPSSCVGLRPWTPWAAGWPPGARPGARGRALGPSWGVSRPRGPSPSVRLHAGWSGAKAWGLQGREAQGTSCSVPRRPFSRRNGAWTLPGSSTSTGKRFGPPPSDDGLPFVSKASAPRVCLREYLRLYPSTSYAASHLGIVEGEKRDFGQT